LTELWRSWYRPPYPWVRRSDSRIRYLVLHHTAGPPGQNPEIIRTFHEKDRRWPHIGYHYLATPTSLYKTLPINAVPVCVKRYNPEAICVAVTGDWSQGVPAPWKSPEAAAVMRELAQVVKDILEAHPNVKLVRHRDLIQTDCPGILTWGMVLNWGREVKKNA
jgi:hypothetical protein